MTNEKYITMTNKEYDDLAEEAKVFRNENLRGICYGFEMALRAVRKIDKEMEYPQIMSHESDFIKYNAQKDLLYKIYRAIQKEQAIEIIDENDY